MPEAPEHPEDEAGDERAVAVAKAGLGEASPQAEAEAALVSLGYKPLEAQKAINAVKAEHSDTAGLIRAALKSMLKT